MDKDSPDQRFRELVAAYETELLRLCCCYLQDRMLAEDAVQNTFEKVYRNLDRLQPDRSEKAWLYRIAVNCCHDIRRGAWFRHTSRSVTPELLPEKGADPPSDDALAIHQAISGLAAKQREVILLYYYQQFTVAEISEILGISQSSVSGRLNRARHQLKKLLTDEEGW